MPMRNTGRRRFLKFAGLTVLGFLAGCAGVGDENDSDDSDGGGESNGGGSENGSNGGFADGSSDGAGDQSSDDTVDESSAGTDEDGASGEPTSSGETIVVGPGGSLEFSPDTLEIETGDTVEFVWEGSNHNIVVADQPDDANWEGVPGLKDRGYTTAHTFTVPGSYEYYCQPHRAVGMEGSITVR